MARYVGTTRSFLYPKEFTTLPKYTAHRGQLVRVLRRLRKHEADVLMYEILASDGWIGHAYPEELGKARGPRVLWARA